MRKYKVEFSKKYEFDFGVRYHTKIVGVKELRCPINKTSRKEVYYMWTDEPHEEEDVLEFDIKNYITKKETYEVDGSERIAIRIVGLKS